MRFSNKFLTKENGHALKSESHSNTQNHENLFAICKLGSHGIEPKRDKGKKNSRKKKVLCIQKTFNKVFKNGFNPKMGSSVICWFTF